MTLGYSLLIDQCWQQQEGSSRETCLPRSGEVAAKRPEGRSPINAEQVPTAIRRRKPLRPRCAGPPPHEWGGKTRHLRVRKLRRGPLEEFEQPGALALGLRRAQEAASMQAATGVHHFADRR